jgi:hypothetical protein
VGQAEVLLTAARQAMTDAATSGSGDADAQALSGELAGYLANIAFFRQEPARIRALARDAMALAPPPPI